MGRGFRMLLLLAALSPAVAPVAAETQAQSGDCPPRAGAEAETGKQAGQAIGPCDEEGSDGRVAGKGADGKRQMERNVYFPLMRFEVPSWLRWWDPD